jgi:hypothetical protein
MMELGVYGLITMALAVGVMASLMPIRMHVITCHFMQFAQIVAVCAVALAVISK